MAGPLGLLFSALYLVPLRRAFAATEEGSVDGTEHQIEITGAWLSAVALVSLVGLLGWCAGTEVEERTRNGLAATHLAVAAASGLAAAAAAWRRRRRARWLDRVRAGREPGFEVWDGGVLWQLAADLPPLVGGYSACDAVLVERRQGVGAGAYRVGVDVVARARVDGAGRDLQAVES